jgi:hypothetical protein
MDLGAGAGTEEGGAQVVGDKSLDGQLVGEGRNKPRREKSCQLAH